MPEYFMSYYFQRTGGQTERGHMIGTCSRTPSAVLDDMLKKASDRHDIPANQIVVVSFNRIDR